MLYLNGSCFRISRPSLVRSGKTKKQVVVQPVISDSMGLHGLQHSRLPCPSPPPRVCSNSCLLSRWCHSTFSSSVAHFSSCLLSFPASESFPMSQLFASGGQSTRASASVLPMHIKGWFPLGLTSLITLLSKGLSKIFSSITVQKLSTFFMVQLSHPYMSTGKTIAFLLSTKWCLCLLIHCMNLCWQSDVSAF